MSKTINEEIRMSKQNYENKNETIRKQFIFLPYPALL